MFRSKFLLAALLATTAALVAPATSDAAFTIRVHQVGMSESTDLFVTDGGAGDTGGAGIIVMSGFIGDFGLTANIATSNATTNSSPALLTINSVALTAGSFTGTRTIVITVEDTGFTAPAPGPNLVRSQLTANTFVGATGSLAQFQSFVGSDAGTELSLNSLGSAGITDELNVPSSPYTIRNVLTVTLTSGGYLLGTGSTEVAPAPAPAGLVMFASALPFAAFLRIRRRKVEPATAA